MSNGDLSPGAVEDYKRAIASMADFYDMKELDISGEDGDVVIETKYGAGYELKDIHNAGSGTATVKCKTYRSQSTTVTIKIPTLLRSGRLPNIHTLVKSGSSDDLVLFLQKR